MSLVINHNLMAMNAARNLNSIYNKLSVSVQRLSSGLRINSAADDAAGLAIRELMRSDIAVINQGVRNASDGISLIQTAEGAMSVIDEKLIRMKELAEQAATGTYTTAQRAIMNSEYQAMAAEIDRIANATDFNQVKLLDGSMATLHEGSGLKIHFGTGNDPDEDYYFLSIGDMRATESTGLRVGGGGIVEAVDAGSGTTVATTGSVWRTTSLNMANTDVQTFTNGGYLGVQTSSDGTNWSTYGYTYIDNVNDTLQDVVDSINLGSGESATVTFDAAATPASVDGTTITIDGFDYIFDSSLLTDLGGVGYMRISTMGLTTAEQMADLFRRKVCSIADYNNSPTNQVATMDTGDPLTVNLWNLEWGANHKPISSATGLITVGAATFAGGGTTLLTAEAVTDGSGYELQITGDAGIYVRLVKPDGTIFTNNTADGGGTPTASSDSSLALIYPSGFPLPDPNGLDEATEWYSSAPTEETSGEEEEADTIYDPWSGSHILTQSAAQLALAALDTAINKKDTARANLGAVQNRLENTITNLEIQAENLQAAESRISDADIASEMTEFTSSNILAQAAVSMLAQANSLPQLALQLLS